MTIGSVIDDRPLFKPHGVRTVWLAGLAVLALVLGGWLIVTVSDPGFMPVTQVRVEGEFKQLRRADLHAAIAQHATGGFFSVNVAAVRQAAQQLPWVAAASVRRVWPDTLVVNVTEHRAVARWRDGALLNDQGEVFRPAPDNVPTGLPELVGPDGNAALILEQWKVLETALAPINQHVQRIVQDERRAWSVRLNNGVELWLGRADVAERMRRYVAAYPLALAPRATQLAAVDLRYTNGFAARWHSGPVTRH